MSLSGNLDFVPIDEVLRLLTRSHQQGSVAVTGTDLHGRVFVGEGGIDLATTFNDDELHRHLVNSGYAEERSLNRIATAESTLAAVAESNTAIVELIREMTVESLHQIATRGDEFVVHEGATSPFASPKSFELESLVRDSEERKREWAQVGAIIPDLSGAIRLRRDLGDREEVTVKADDWKLLSEVGNGTSVQEIADHLGTTEFWTARVAARLVNDDLVLLDGTGEPEAPEGLEEPNATTAAPSDELVGEEEPSDEYAAYKEEPTDPDNESDDSVLSDEPSTPAPDSLVPEDHQPDHNESWWREPDPDEAADNEQSTPEVVSEGLSQMPAAGDANDEVEEDTEAFLEKVFSELESSDSQSLEPESSDSEPSESEPSESEDEEGHGLLRRRRMGLLRDFSSDS